MKKPLKIVRELILNDELNNIYTLKLLTYSYTLKIHILTLQ